MKLPSVVSPVGAENISTPSSRSSAVSFCVIMLPWNGTLCTKWFNGYDNQTTCGSVKGYSLAETNGSGSADLVWHTPGTSGIYYLNFTPLVAAAGAPYPPLYEFKNGWTYSMPIVVYSSNYSQALLNISISAPPTGEPP